MYLKEPKVGQEPNIPWTLGNSIFFLLLFSIRYVSSMKDLLLWFHYFGSLIEMANPHVYIVKRPSLEQETSAWIFCIL